MSSTSCFYGFDIETRPDPTKAVRFARPFPDFDPAEVKCGNMKDAGKIAEKIQQAEADHASKKEAYNRKVIQDAALNPFAAEIAVIGLITEDLKQRYLQGREREVLEAFWQTYRTASSTRQWVFWSGCGAAAKMFDLDFIITRSRILGVRIPPGVRNGRFYGSRFTDLASEFLLYQNDAYLSLTTAADIFGLYEQCPNLTRKSDTDLVTGANFHKWYDGPPEECEKALNYLENDLLHLAHLAHRIL